MKTRIALMMLGVALGAFLGGFLSSETITYSNSSQTLDSFMSFSGMGNQSGPSEATILVPAVDENGDGVATVLSVQIIPGTRRALVDIDKLLFFTDTQNSIRVSRSVSENVTGKDLSFYDIIYSVKANASVIEGPSAGAAMTIATISALEGRELDERVMMTGTINHDGTIGPVGEILAKAQAALDIGAGTFLVPEGQSTETVTETRERCRDIGVSRVCNLERIPSQVDVGEEAGIEVVEVRDIREAMGYFFQ